MERKIFSELDHNPAVKCYTPEPFRIPYEHDGRSRNYVPDIFVEYSDNTKEVVEIKPIYQVGHPNNISKFEAAKRYCDEYGFKFRIQVVRGVGYLSSEIHTIEKKYEHWQEAVGDWKNLRARIEARWKSQSNSNTFGDIVKGVFGWAVIIYTLTDILRSCK